MIKSTHPPRLAQVHDYDGPLHGLLETWAKRMLMTSDPETTLLKFSSRVRPMGACYVPGVPALRAWLAAG